MNHMKWIVSLFAIALLACAANVARAADPSVTGHWVSKVDALKIEMDFTSEGQCSATATANGRSSSFTGTYKVSATELVITPKGTAAITYGMKYEPDKMTLTGGDLGEGKSFTFDRIAGVGAPPAVTTTDKPAPEKTADKPAPEKTADKPADKTADPELPGGAWDTKAFADHFTIMKTKVDSEKISWLLERKDDAAHSYDASFYDEDDVKLATINVSFEPSLFQVAKGERTRGTVLLPTPEMMKKAKKVVIMAR